MSNRKKVVKEKLAERRKFYDALAKLEVTKFKLQKAQRRLEPGAFRVTFSFSPEELGIDCLPTAEQIEKLGLKRALERLDRRELYTDIALIAKGSPSKERLASIRNEVLENTKKRFTNDGTLNLASFATTAGETNETDQGPATTTEL